PASAPRRRSFSRPSARGPPRLASPPDPPETRRKLDRMPMLLKEEFPPDEVRREVSVVTHDLGRPGKEEDFLAALVHRSAREHLLSSGARSRANESVVAPVQQMDVPPRCGSPTRGMRSRQAVRTNWSGPTGRFGQTAGALWRLPSAAEAAAVATSRGWVPRPLKRK